MRILLNSYLIFYNLFPVLAFHCFYFKETRGNVPTCTLSHPFSLAVRGRPGEKGKQELSDFNFFRVVPSHNCCELDPAPSLAGCDL
jgi:hypothetical protein